MMLRMIVGILALMAGGCASASGERAVALRPGEPCPVAVEKGDTPPKLVYRASPDYPPAAFTKGIEGTVMVEFVIDERGEPRCARVVKSIPALDKAALRCLARFRFTPALKDGKPVATAADMPVTFTIMR